MRNRFDLDAKEPADRKVIRSGSLGGRQALGSPAMGLSPSERELKQGLFQRVVKMLDLSLLGGLEDKEARIQIRETCEALMGRMPCRSIFRRGSALSRRSKMRSWGSAHWSKSWPTRPSPTYWSTAPARSMSSGTESSSCHRCISTVNNT